MFSAANAELRKFSTTTPTPTTTNGSGAVPTTTNESSTEKQIGDRNRLTGGDNDGKGK